jgi:hypothetical protein
MDFQKPPSSIKNSDEISEQHLHKIIHLQHISHSRPKISFKGNSTFEVTTIMECNSPLRCNATQYTMWWNQQHAHSEHFSLLMMEEAGSSKLVVHLHQITGCHSRRENLSNNTL